MTIYTVLRVNDIHNAPDIITLGSWRTRREALRKCAGAIVKEAELEDDFRDLLRNDENHGDLPNAPLDSKEVTDYIMDELGGQGGYALYNDVFGTVRFYVEENELAD